MGTLHHIAAYINRWNQDAAAVMSVLSSISDEELNAMFPPTGYKILDPPPGYQPVRNEARLLATPTPMGQTPGFSMAATLSASKVK